MRKLQKVKFQCPKCGNRTAELDEFRAVGNFAEKLFNIQTRRFSTLTCTKCSYTEIYRTRQSQIGNVLDFFTN